MADPPEGVRSFLLALLDREWGVKEGLEARAAAMLSAHTATVAAALAGAALSGVEEHMAEGVPLGLNVLSVAAILFSVGASLLAILPGDYPVVDVDDLRDLIGSGSTDGVADSLVDDIAIVRHKNQSKGLALAASQAAFAVAVAAFVAALIIAI